MNVNKRLRKVDLRLAGVSRRLGYLEGRVYFKPIGAKEYEEVPVIEFRDLGITPRNFRTGEDIQAHRYQARVSKDWFLANTGRNGRYAIKRREGTEPIQCELEGLSCDDADTMASLDLRTSEKISYAERNSLN